MAPEIDPTGSPGRWTQPANMDMVSGMTQTPPSNIPTFDGEEILAGIRRWVEIETPSHDGAAVIRLVDVVESDLARIGARTTRTPGRDGYGYITAYRPLLLQTPSPWLFPNPDGGRRNN